MNKPVPASPAQISDEQLQYERLPVSDKPCANGKHFTLAYRRDVDLDVVFICPVKSCPLFEKTISLEPVEAPKMSEEEYMNTEAGPAICDSCHKPMSKSEPMCEFGGTCESRPKPASSRLEPVEAAQKCKNCDKPIENGEDGWLHVLVEDYLNCPTTPKVEPVEAVSTRLACYCDQITCPICYPPVEAVSITPVKACHCGLDACIGVDKLIAPYVCVRELGAKQVSTPLPQQGYEYKILYEKKAKQLADLISRGHQPSIDIVARLLAKEDEDVR